MFPGDLFIGNQRSEECPAIIGSRLHMQVDKLQARLTRAIRRVARRASQKSVDNARDVYNHCEVQERVTFFVSCRSHRKEGRGALVVVRRLSQTRWWPKFGRAGRWSDRRWHRRQQE